MASLRSTPSDSLEPVSCSTVAGARALIDSQDALSVFETMAVEDRTCDWAERRVGGLDLRTGILIMHIS